MKVFSLKRAVNFFFVLLLIGLMSCNVETEERDTSHLLKVIHQEGDTIITFDPKTQQTSITVIKDASDAPVNSISPVKATNQESDTIITFDPDTYKESMTVIHYTNGQADTIQVY